MLTPITLTNTLTLLHLVPSLQKQTKHYFKFIKSHSSLLRRMSTSFHQGEASGYFLPKSPEACRERPPAVHPVLPGLGLHSCASAGRQAFAGRRPPRTPAREARAVASLRGLVTSLHCAGAACISASALPGGKLVVEHREVGPNRLRADWRLPTLRFRVGPPECPTWRAWCSVERLRCPPCSPCLERYCGHSVSARPGSVAG